MKIPTPFNHRLIPSLAIVSIMLYGFLASANMEAAAAGEKKKFPSRVKFLDKEIKKEIRLPDFENIVLSGAKEVYFEFTGGPTSLTVISSLANPLDYLDYSVQDRTLYLEPTSITYRDAAEADASGNLLFPNDLITLVIKAPCLKNFVSHDFFGNFYIGKWDSEAVINMSLCSCGNFFMDSVETNILNISSAGKDKIFIDKIKTNSCNITNNGQSTLDMNGVEIKAINISCSAESTTLLEGKAANVNYYASAGAVVEASELSADIVNACATSGASILCDVRRMFRAQAGDNAVILYSGSPTNVYVSGTVLPLNP
ncbi:MAG: hypothetical protein HDS82_00435 [Bacteroidales bacterium]|nr:hypothetical protein [Bacteroidales bacterium]